MLGVNAQSDYSPWLKIGCILVVPGYGDLQRGIARSLGYLIALIECYLHRVLASDVDMTELGETCR